MNEQEYDDDREFRRGYQQVPGDVHPILSGILRAHDFPITLTNHEAMALLRMIDAVDHVAGAEIDSTNWEAFCVEFQNAYTAASELIQKLRPA